MALVNRGVTYGQQGDVERALADCTAVVTMTDIPAEDKAFAFLNRAIAHYRQGDIERVLADYTAVVEMADAPVDLKAEALVNRGFQNCRAKKLKEAVADYEAVLEIPGVSAERCTEALFAKVEPMIELRSRGEIGQALTRAFKEGDPQASEYGGTPQDLLWMVLQRGPAEWDSYVSEIVPLFVKYGVAEKLGQGLTKSIQHLDEGGFSISQIDTWNSAWQQVGEGCDNLEIPLRCLNAAVEVMKAAPPTDRPLFQLPLEIRRIVRPLLNRSLGESER